MKFFTFMQSQKKATLRGPRSIRWAAAALAVWLGTFPVGAADVNQTNSAAPVVIHIGIAPGTWWGVNPNDAKAAISVWAKTILEQNRIAVTVDTQLFETPEELHQALKSGAIDAVSMLTDQFLTLEPALQPSDIFLATKDHLLTEQYMLLVQRDGGIDQVADLAGRKLVLEANARTSLAPQWLDTLLARSSLGPAEQVLGTVTKIESPSKAVLQVFFHQADACLVTSNVFDLACELNPQLRKKLRVLAVSPEVIPAVFFFRPGYTASVRDQMEPAIVSLNNTTAGLQVLTVFQSDGMVKRPVACLEGSRQLLAEFELSKKRPNGSLQTLNQHEPR